MTWLWIQGIAGDPALDLAPEDPQSSNSSEWQGFP